MELQEYKTMFSVEDQHWWYVGMQQITTSLLTHFFPHHPNLQILDAGCGTGAAINYLSSFGTVTGCDLWAEALHFCKQRALSRLARASVTCLPFSGNRFDLITSFDVLYHRRVGNYRNALNEFNRVLKPGGRIFLRLPAYNWLQAHHDQIIHTAHRFTTGELRQSFHETHFTVEKLTYANISLFPLIAGKRLIFEKIFPGGDSSDVRPNPPWQDKLFVQPLLGEAKWLPQHNLPFGLTVIAIGKKQ
jgi:ubiquinone/menaquinone biosynthesis C-methylase UbiE